MKLTHLGKVLLISSSFSFLAGAATAAETATPIKRGKPTKKSDRYTLYDAKIVKDKLEVQIGHAGGCKKHVFTLYWSGSVKESSPAQLPLVLHHNANGDTCEAFYKGWKAFDLTLLKKKVRGKKMILLLGKKRLVYTPKR
jgi:hypothetical protein